MARRVVVYNSFDRARSARTGDASRATPKTFWSYQPGSETPSLAEAIRMGAISEKTTSAEWEKLSPGMRREIVRSYVKKNKNADGVGTPEEVAYGEGWHSRERKSPYDDPKLTSAWERGRKDREVKGRMSRGYFAGEVRGKRFEPARQRDYKSEKGYVAKLLDAQSGAVLARSEPYITNGAGLKGWIMKTANELIKSGKRVKAEVNVVFYDPNYA